jgi:hypothetical protein
VDVTEYGVRGIRAADPIWKAPKAAVRDEIANAERAAKATQDKLDPLDEAFLFERSIDIETYDRHTAKLREELTLLRIDRHADQLEELDVEGRLRHKPVRSRLAFRRRARAVSGARSHPGFQRPNRKRLTPRGEPRQRAVVGAVRER